MRPTPCDTLAGFGWQPDVADHRDFTLEHDAVAKLLRKLNLRKRRSGELPERIDGREYCGPVLSQQEPFTASAHACAALVQQFERRASGRVLHPSRLFLDSMARRMLHHDGRAGVSLRSVLKALVRCGVPPERYWPYDPPRLGAPPDGFAYCFQRGFASIRYLRLDDRGHEAAALLDRLKRCVAGGFFFVCGFPLCSSLGQDAEIPFPTLADRITGGQAVTVVGYDDALRIRSQRGAFLIRNSWSPQWGDGGFGWLPYRYVSDGLACDFWTLLKPAWLRSGEFEQLS